MSIGSIFSVPGGGAAAAAASFDPTSTSWTYTLFDDFHYNVAPSYGGPVELFMTSNTGTWAKVTSTTSLNGHPGIWVAGTSTTATASASFYWGTDLILFGANREKVGHAIQLLATPDGTETFTVKLGFINTVPGTVSNGCFFNIDRSRSTTNIYAVCVKGSSETAQDTGVAFDTNWHTYSVEVNAAGTQAVFKIDGAVTNTISTNIPTAAGQTVTGGFTCQKVAGSASQSINVDWFYHEYQLGAARGVF